MAFIPFIYVENKSRIIKVSNLIFLSIQLIDSLEILTEKNEQFCAEFKAISIYLFILFFLNNKQTNICNIYNFINVFKLDRTMNRIYN